MTLYTVECTDAEKGGMWKIHQWHTGSCQAMHHAATMCLEDGKPRSVYRWKVDSGREDVCAMLNGRMSYTHRWLVHTVWMDENGEVKSQRVALD